MGRPKTDLFKINGKPMLAPDNGVGFSYEDLDASDSGRDESGIMHRIVVRYKVGKWSFEFGSISETDRQYIESLFADNAEFEFTHPDRNNAGTAVTSRCYRSKYDLSWYNAKKGMWQNYKFNIVEC